MATMNANVRLVTAPRVLRAVVGVDRQGVNSSIVHFVGRKCKRNVGCETQQSDEQASAGWRREKLPPARAAIVCMKDYPSQEK